MVKKHGLALSLLCQVTIAVCADLNVGYLSEKKTDAIYALPSFGEEMVLSDGSIWFVNPKSYEITSKWSEKNTVILSKNDLDIYCWSVKNQSTNAIANAASAEEYLYSCPTRSGWKNISPRNHYGVNLILSGIHSKQSCGIGEYYDLLYVIKWCKNVGFDVIQLLPLNEMLSDFSPYNSCSSCALNHLYISLSALPFINEDKKFARQIEKLQKLNSSSKVQFEKVSKGKDAFLRGYFKLFYDRYSSQESFNSFVESNDWLIPFAVFRALQIQYKGLSHDKWNTKDKIISKERMQEIIKENKDEINYQIFLQYLCFTQLSDVKKIANENGVFLLGDVPILVNFESADVWFNRQNFNVDYTVGCPPDQYNSEGQNWGMPAYNWDFMKTDGYAFWKNRLNYACNFYDIYRIDHIFGLFRFWLILKGQHASSGFYEPNTEERWLKQGRELLDALISFSSMLPIGEDLGVYPSGVSQVLKEFGVCGLKVMRWQFHSTTPITFLESKNYPILSLTTLSTHDSETLDGWWSSYKNDREALCKQFKYHCSNKITQEQRESMILSSFDSSSIFHVNLLQEYLNLIPDLSWQNPMLDRINTPGSISKDNWSFRTKTSIESITENDELKQKIIEMLKIANDKTNQPTIDVAND